MMQLTTLNKVVSLFLVGGLVLLAVIFLFGPDLDHIYIFSESKAQALLVLVGALSLLALAAAVGAVVDTLASLTLGHWLRKCITHKQLAVCFGQRHSFDDFDSWRKCFGTLIETREPIKTLVPAIRGHELSLGSAIFFKTSSQGLISWAEGHYAAYLYATNLAFLSLLTPIVLFASGRAQQLSGWALGSYITLSIGLGLVFSSMAIDKYLYTHEVSFRQASLVLLEEAVGSA
jgi:hypothetical protein